MRGCGGERKGRKRRSRDGENAAEGTEGSGTFFWPYRTAAALAAAGFQDSRVTRHTRHTPQAYFYICTLQSYPGIVSKPPLFELGAAGIHIVSVATSSALQGGYAGGEVTAWFPGLLPRGIQSILCIYEGPASYAINGGYIWICSLLGVQRSNPCFGVMKGEETGKKKKNHYRCAIAGVIQAPNHRPTHYASLEGPLGRILGEPRDCIQSERRKVVLFPEFLRPGRVVTCSTRHS